MSRPIDPRLLKAVPECRELVGLIGALQAISAGLIVVQAGVLAHVIATIFAGRPRLGAVTGALVLLGAAGVGRAFVAAGQEWLTARASVAVRSRLREVTLRAIVRAGPGWARRQPAGRLVTATGAGLDGLDGYLTRALPAVVAAMIVPPVVLVRLAWADWQSGLILLVLLPLVPLFMALVGITTKRHVARQYAILGRLSGQFLDLLRGLRTLRVYGQARAQERTLHATTDAYRRHTLVTLRVAFLSGLILDLLAALSVALVAVDVGLRLDSGHVPFETALLVLILAPEVFAPLRAMGAQHHANEEGSTAISAALDLVDESPVAAASDGEPAAVRLGGAVDLLGVDVVYPGRERAALTDVTVNLRPGITALTGPSGSGKSTLLATLLGFVEPTRGAVRVDVGDRPVALAEVDRDAWRRGVAWVPQRPRPTQASVAAEVGLGDPDADGDAITAVCRLCRTPDPATPLDEDGLGVSAGQRRRIALARAVLRARKVAAAGGTPLVLLDEPGEDLDEATEAVVAAVIADLRDWATVAVATHSERLAELADVRLTLDSGRLAGISVCVPHAAAEPAPRTSPEPLRVATQPAQEPTRLGLRGLVRAQGTRNRLRLAGGLAVLSALAGLGLTATSMWLISRAAQHPNVQALAVAVVGVRTFALGRALLRYLERLVAHDGALRMLTDLRGQIFAALRTMPPNAMALFRRGDLLRRFIGDVDGAQEGLVRAAVPGCGAVAGGVGAAVLAAMIDPAAGLVLGVGLLLAAGAALLTYLAAGSGGGLVDAAGRRDRASTALVDGLDELVAYDAADAAVTGVAALEAEVCHLSRRPALAVAAGTLGAGVVSALTLVGVLVAAAAAAHDGRLSVVNIGVLAVCVLTGFEGVAALPPAFAAWSRCRAGLARVGFVLAEPQRRLGAAKDAPADDCDLALVGRDLALAPAAGAAPVLVDADLTVRPHERVALIGPSGCGKSTLLAAALGLLATESGSLALASAEWSEPVGDLDPDDVPSLIAGSLQGDHVFDASLRDNLRVVRPAAGDGELDAVAARAGLLEVIRALPAGWSTPAGPDGAALSGGQRQRLLLARALLANPTILVLDEPTAHLDERTEALVLADLLDATAGRTLLVTTHRRSVADGTDRTLRVVDRLVVDDEPSSDPRSLGLVMAAAGSAVGPTR